MFDSAEEALPFAEEIPGPSTEALERECRRLGMHVVCGMLERDGDALHNSAVLIGPDGLIGTYRKTHLPFLGVDRFVVRGDELAVYDTPLGRIGLEICYDLRFPEVTRTLALKGADIIATRPTCRWPPGRRPSSSRGRGGREPRLPADVEPRRQGARGLVLGWSQIVDPDGTRLAEAGADEEALLVADIDLERARDKDFVIPGEYELYLFGHRRPDLYGALVEETVRA